MTAGDPVLVGAAPSERAPAPVAVEWVTVTRSDESMGPPVIRHGDRDTAEEIECLGDQYAAAALIRLADYDRMAKALALLATVDVAALHATAEWLRLQAGVMREFGHDAGGATKVEALAAAIDSAIAAIEATRATQEGK